MEEGRDGGVGRGLGRQDGLRVEVEPRLEFADLHLDTAQGVRGGSGRRLGGWGRIADAAKRFFVLPRRDAAKRNRVFYFSLPELKMIPHKKNAEASEIRAPHGHKKKCRGSEERVGGGTLP